MMEQANMFEQDNEQPLAARMRPRDLTEFVGQQHLLGPGKILRRLIEEDRITSMIFWGPPGVGKTTESLPAGHRPLLRISLPSPAESRKQEP